MGLAILQIHVEPMTTEDFAPFGLVLAQSPDRKPDMDDAGSAGWSYPLVVDGTPQLILARTPYLGLRFSKLERHLHVSQAFIPLAGPRSAVVVGEPTGLGEKELPRPESLRAFVVDAGIGYVLHRGTWHSLDRYPLTPGRLDVVIVSEVETTAETVSGFLGPMVRSQEVDLSLTHGIAIEIIP